MQTKEALDLAQSVQDQRLSIAIDGLAGAGKTTLGMALGEALSIPVLDTGLMYREVTRQTLAPENRQNEAAAEIARRLRFDLSGMGRGSRLAADGTDLDEVALHTIEIDNAVPGIAAQKDVRAALVKQQRRLAGETAIAMIGRDIGTVVLPDAPVKLYLVADESTRAERRDATHAVGVTLIAKSMARRDETDQSRPHSPLKKPEGALELDTGILTVQQTVDAALEAIEHAVSKRVG